MVKSAARTEKGLAWIIYARNKLSKWILSGASIILIKKNFHNREKHLWNFRFSHLSASAGPFKDFAADHLKADKKNKSA